ncbi:MAG: hypothetical protein GKR99_18615 [Rhodobacteraceae bacterium]|nr:hypothetical protein [Paracoccaceae bacterium]
MERKIIVQALKRSFSTQSANFNHCDYAIGFDPIVFGDRYLRCPLYTIYDEYQQICEPRAALTRQDLDARDGFCGYVVSASTHSAPHRGDAFAAFDAARGVASGGKHLRNTDALQQLEKTLPGAQAKAQFLGRYRFSMAYENASHPGYCTEKIVQSFAARTIPIYWGDPLVTEDFNPAAFVNANELASLDALVAEVLRIEDDPDVCLKMLNAPVFQPGRSGVHLAELEAFLARLVTTPASDLRRRALHGSGARIDARAARAARSFWRR